MKTVAKIIIRDNNSKILVLTRSSSHPVFANHLDFPGGEIELGENNKLAIVRETKEETGLVLSLRKIKVLFDKKINDDLIHILYSYQFNDIEPQLIMSWEHSSYLWINQEQLLKEPLPRNVDPYYKNVIDFLGS